MLQSSSVEVSESHGNEWGNSRRKLQVVSLFSSPLEVQPLLCVQVFNPCSSTTCQKPLIELKGHKTVSHNSRPQPINNVLPNKLSTNIWPCLPDLFYGMTYRLIMKTGFLIIRFACPYSIIKAHTEADFFFIELGV